MSKNVAGCGETILLSLFGFNLLSNHNMVYWYCASRWSISAHSE